MDGKRLPLVSASASRDAESRIHVSLCNLHHAADTEIAIEIRGDTRRSVSGRILTAPAPDSHNTFEEPQAVAPGPYTEARLSADRLSAKLPARSVVVLELI
jgi:alpha-N-arabinofuranosidase